MGTFKGATKKLPTSWPPTTEVDSYLLWGTITTQQIMPRCCSRGNLMYKLINVEVEIIEAMASNVYNGVSDRRIIKRSFAFGGSQFI